MGNSKRIIFVFGSNLAGRHGLGAALVALNYFGAQYGEGSGHFGDSFAIPTKDEGLRPLPITVIREKVIYFVDYMTWALTQMPHYFFFITRVGCGLANYKDRDIAPLFHGIKYLTNHSIPIEWYKYIYDGTEPSTGTIRRREKYQDIINNRITADGDDP